MTQAFSEVGGRNATVGLCIEVAGDFPVLPSIKSFALSIIFKVRMLGNVAVGIRYQIE